MNKCKSENLLFNAINKQKGDECMLKIPKAKIKPPMPSITSIPTEMKIKTIAENDPGIFDCEVNALLENGWALVDRRVITPNGSKLIVFYASLEKLITPDLDVYLKGKEIAHCVTLVKEGE